MKNIRLHTLFLFPLLIVLLGGCIDSTRTAGDSHLRLVTLSSGRLTPPFHPDTLDYQAELDADTPTVRITAYARNAEARIEVNGKRVTDGLPGKPIALAPGRNLVRITVLSKDGSSQTQYRFEIYRGKIPDGEQPGDSGSDGGDAGNGGSNAGNGGDGTSPGSTDNGNPGDATLSALKLLEIPLDQIFQAEQKDYTATAGALVDAVHVLVSTNTGNTVTLNGHPLTPGVPSSPVALHEGINRIEIRILSADKSATQTYTVQITRRSTAEFGGNTRLLSSRPEKGAQFGFSTALSGDTLAIGAPEEANGSGAVYVYARNDQGWTLQQRLSLSDRSSGDRFGQSLALRGNTLIIGAMQRAVDNRFNAGKVYIYARNSSGQWQQTHALTAPSPQAGHRFGYQVALDGQRLAVASLLGPDNGRDSGQVFLFHQNGNNGWGYEATVGEAGIGSSDKYAANIDLDGDLLAIGAFNQPDCSTSDDPDAGSVRLYRHEAGTWKLMQTLQGEGPGDRFGFSVDLSGGKLAIGAQCEDPDHGPLTQGAVYIYQQAGEQFQLRQKLKAFQTGDYSLFGDRVAWQGDQLIVTGSWEIPSHNDHSHLEGAGAAYLIVKNGDRWEEKKLFLPNFINEYDRFGISLSVDGGRSLIGAPGVERNPSDPDSDAKTRIGAAYLFQ